MFPGCIQDSADKETNTECVFIQPPIIGRKGGRSDGLAIRPVSSTPSIVKRSKTFSPSAPINKAEYNCRVSYLSHLHFALLITRISILWLFTMTEPSLSENLIDVCGQTSHLRTMKSFKQLMKVKSQDFL